MIEASCIGIQMCYIYNSGETELESFRRKILDCLMNGGLLFSVIKPELYETDISMTKEFLEEIRSCLERDLIPGDVRVALAIVRYIRSVLFHGGGG
ncbi:hypothetical protein V5799_029506 [Amblyomma americanum]|uniref:Uncharacterized protein n=1 Tax=Amblyomma americanum TaxID=6943 RepID=A0AAQ4ER08_AMBAM